MASDTSDARFTVLVIHTTEDAEPEGILGLTQQYRKYGTNFHTECHSVDIGPRTLFEKKSVADLREYASEVLKIVKTLDTSAPRPIIFVGIGLATLAIIEAVMKDESKDIFTTLGLVVSIAPDTQPEEQTEGQTGKRPEKRYVAFKHWYDSLGPYGRPERKNLREFLGKFDKHCRKNYLRVSCTSESAKEEKLFISELFPYGRIHAGDKISVWQRVEEHISSSWPEVLLELVKSGDIKAPQYCLSLIEDNWGKLCHEALVVKVLHEAVEGRWVGIVKKLLEDGVHPDVRLHGNEKSALQIARSPEIRKLLLKHGAKSHQPPSVATCWRGVESKIGEHSEKEVDEVQEEFGGMQEEVDGEPVLNEHDEEFEFRAVIVDIYSPKTKDSSQKMGKAATKTKTKTKTKTETEGSQPAPGGSAPGDGKEEKPLPDVADHEFHRIAHPTVEDLVYGRGPSNIMGTRASTADSALPDGKNAIDYHRFRWIHLPMNNMKWLRDLAKKVCNEHCLDHKHPESQPQPFGNEARSRRSSIASCNEKCLSNYGGTENTFPCIPGCADSLFEARYWLGHQEDSGTNLDSHIRCINPQFRRLNLVNAKRTGFAIMLPFVHFDKFSNVKSLKGHVHKTVHESMNKIDDDNFEDDRENYGYQSEFSEDEVMRVISVAKINPSPSPGDKSGSTRIEVEKMGEKKAKGGDYAPSSPRRLEDVVANDLFDKMPLHCRRTLREFYFRSREIRKLGKPVITEYFERTWPGKDALSLMVDQLWMLVLVDGTIITAFPSQMNGTQREHPYIYTDLVEYILAHLRRKWRMPISSILDLSFMIIQETAGFLFNQRSQIKTRFRFLGIYDRCLRSIAADEVDYFEELASNVSGIPHPGSDQQEQEAQDSLGKLLELDRSSKVTMDLQSIKNIRRELNILMEIVDTQKSVIKQMVTELESKEFEVFKTTNDLRQKRKRRSERLRSREEQLNRLDKKAARIQEDLEFFAKQKDNRIRSLESFFAGRLADRSEKANNIILFFTCVTTFFTPLSFLAAFFALQIHEFPQGDQGLDLPLSWVCRYIFGIGLPIVALLATAFWWFGLDGRQNGKISDRLWEQVKSLGKSPEAEAAPATSASSASTASPETSVFSVSTASPVTSVFPASTAAAVRFRRREDEEWAQLE